MDDVNMSLLDLFLSIIRIPFSILHSPPDYADLPSIFHLTFYIPAISLPLTL